jgi:U4/U6 small nuclear ribonucleoprotein PRP3
VVVEGGPKGIAAYKKLLLRRIDWTQYQDKTADPNLCTLVWEVYLTDEGTSAAAQFPVFQVEDSE